MNTMTHDIRTTTHVLTAVARFELTPSIPILARIDVRAAKTAEPIEKSNHIEPTSYSKDTAFLSNEVKKTPPVFQAVAAFSQNRGDAQLNRVLPLSLIYQIRIQSSNLKPIIFCKKKTYIRAALFRSIMSQSVMAAMASITGTMRGHRHASCRPVISISAASPFLVTVD